MTETRHTHTHVVVAAVGEAIYGLAMERNPNVVKLSSYAPLLQNFNSYEWTVRATLPNELESMELDTDDI